MKNLLLLLLIVSAVSCQYKFKPFLEDGIVKCQEDAKVGSVGKLNGITYKVVDSIMLYNMVKNNDNITNICTSKITNMESLFWKYEFNGDISNWDVSNVTNMRNMFEDSQFNGDISNWVNKYIPEGIVTKEFTKDCKGKEVAFNYLKRLKLSQILWLHDEGYIGGACTGKPNEYCGRVEKYIDGKYWTYDIGVVLSQESCTVIGTWDNFRR